MSRPQLKLVHSDNNVVSNIPFVDIYMKLEKLWKVREILEDNEVEDELPSIYRRIDQMEQNAWACVNQVENIKIKHAEKLLQQFHVNYVKVESSEEVFAHTFIPCMFGTLTTIHLTDFNKDLIFVHGLGVLNNFETKEISFMVVNDSDASLVNYIDEIVKNFNYLAQIKTYDVSELEYNLLVAINQVCELDISSKQVHIENNEIQSSNGRVIDCRFLFEQRKFKNDTLRRFNKLPNYEKAPIVGMNDKVADIPTFDNKPYDDFREFVNGMKPFLKPSDDAS